MADLFPQIALTNTFSQWVATTQKLVSYENSRLVDFTVPIVFANTNIEIENGNLEIEGNLRVDGNVSFGFFSESILTIEGDVNIANLISISQAQTNNLIVNRNLNTYSITTNYLKANNISTPSLKVNSNAIFSNTLTLSTMNLTTANIDSLTGPAYIKIDEKIKSSNAYIFARDNIASFAAFSIGLS